ncbi:uncharacterized protein LOC143635078 [Bidens hawaiensis]|uniref:uncharacterized protein LOC143635078 n=1 Tax=Bidens hawaiensis TaxID=980011 RepID=UPI00404B61AF
MESVFLHIECPDDKQNRFATGVFEKCALTWWVMEKSTRGAEAAMALPWNELKDLMTRSFCPPNELMNLVYKSVFEKSEWLHLEAEFWNLKQEGGEHSAYTSRLNELSVLVPHLVTPNSRAIENYIRGLPRQIQDSFFSSSPKELDDAINLAATLTDNHVKAGTLTLQSSKKPIDKLATEPKETKPGLSKPAYSSTHTTKESPQAPPLLANLAQGQPFPAIQAPAPQEGQSTQSVQAPQDNHGHAFMMNAHHYQAQQNGDVVNDTFLVDDQFASILFDTGADMSFVSLEIELLLAKPRSKVKSSYTIEVANGKSVTIDSVIRSCKMNLIGHTFSIDLIPMQLGSLDIIVGMEWLSSHHVEVVCFEKFIRIPLADGQTLRVHGEKPSPSSLNIITCSQVHAYLRKKYVAFGAHIVEKKEQKIEDILVVREYPEVFPDDVSGLPPVCESEFCIDLVPGANLIAKAPYRLAPSEMQEWSTQLQEILDKGC